MYINMEWQKGVCGERGKELVLFAQGNREMRQVGALDMCLFLDLARAPPTFALCHVPFISLLWDENGWEDVRETAEQAAGGERKSTTMGHVEILLALFCPNCTLLEHLSGATTLR